MDLLQFAKDVAILAQIAPTKNTNISATRCLWSKGGYLTATDLELSVLVKSEVEIPNGVPSRRLNEILSAVLSKGLSGTMKVDAKGLNFEFADGRTTTLPFDAAVEDLPKLPEPHKRKANVKIHPLDLAFVQRAVSHEVVRYALTGICFDGEGKHLVSSDGKRLHFRAFEAEKKFGKVIVPDKAIKLVLNIIKASKGEAKIDWFGLSDDNLQCSFGVGRYIVVSRTIEGNFPDWHAVIPSQFIWRITVPTAPLQEACERSIRFHGKDGRNLCLQLKIGEDGNLAMRTKHADFGEEKYRAPIQEKEGDIRAMQNVVYNSALLKDCLVKSDLTVLQGSGRDAAVVVNGSAVLMPLTVTMGGEEYPVNTDEARKLPAPLKLAKPIPVESVKAGPEDPEPKEAKPKHTVERVKHTVERPTPRPTQKPVERPVHHAPKPKAGPKRPAPKAAEKPKPKPERSAGPRRKPKDEAILERIGQKVKELRTEPEKRKAKEPAEKPEKKKGTRLRDQQVPLFNW
jgi:DNA polymerase-3 subunit beta